MTFITSSSSASLERINVTAAHHDECSTPVDRRKLQLVLQLYKARREDGLLWGRDTWREGKHKDLCVVIRRHKFRQIFTWCGHGWRSWNDERSCRETLKSSDNASVFDISYDVLLDADQQDDNVLWCVHVNMTKKMKRRIAELWKQNPGGTTTTQAKKKSAAEWYRRRFSYPVSNTLVSYVSHDWHFPVPPPWWRMNLVVLPVSWPRHMKDLSRLRHAGYREQHKYHAVWSKVIICDHPGTDESTNIITSQSLWTKFDCWCL